MEAEAGAMYGKNRTASSLKPYARGSMWLGVVFVVFMACVFRYRAKVVIFFENVGFGVL